MTLETSDHDFWHQQFPRRAEMVPLPNAKPRPPAPSYLRETVELASDPSLSDGLRKLSSRLNVPSLAVLLAAFKTVLFRYSGQEMLVVGAAAQAGAEPDGPPAAGPALWPIQTDWSASADLSGKTLACELARQIADAVAHMQYPIRTLQSWAGAQDTAFGARLFNTALCLAQNAERGDNWPMLDPHLGDLLMQCDVVITVAPATSGLILRGNFDSDLFEARTIQRLLGHLGIILEGIVHDPSTPVLRLPILTEPERRQLIAERDESKVDVTPATTMQGAFEAQAERTPEAVAVEYAGNQLSYRELNERANQVAHYLRGVGVGPDTLVSVCMERSFEMVVALYAVMKAGGAYVPIDPDNPPERLAFMLEDAGAPVLLTQSGLVGRLPAHSGRVICLDTDWERIASNHRSNPAEVTGPGNLAYVIYTSGSTGRPKGAMNTHRGICNRLLWMQDQYGLGEADRVLQKTPFSFDVSVWEFFWPLRVGARLVVADPGGQRDAAYLVKLIRKQGITVLHFVPSMLRVFLREPGVEKCESLRHVICSGEALPYDLQEQFFRLLPSQLHNLYGPTEAAVDVTHWTCRRGDGRKVVPIGRPVANTQIYILDCHLEPVPVGVVGELHIGGVQVGRGYHKRPELTAERFIPDPFSKDPEARLYKTGDLCRWLADGAAEYLGRMDFQVKIRGFRIELGEIEEVLREYPGVREAVVVVREEGEKRLVAYTVLRGESACTTAELRDYLKQQLPEYMVPAAWVALPALPLTPNGKLDRKGLPPPGAGSEVSTACVVPLSTVEQKIAAIWQSGLGVAKVGRDDNFFDLGGDSLLLMTVHSQLRQAFNKEISTVDLFRHTTVRGLAQYLTGQSDSNVLEGAQPGGEVRKTVVRSLRRLRACPE
jgi:amino acid adenylation domain-containing protein